MKSRDENGNGNENFDGLGRKPHPLHRTQKQSKRVANGEGGDEAPQPARLLDLCLKFSQDFVTWGNLRAASAQNERKPAATAYRTRREYLTVSG